VLIEPAARKPKQPLAIVRAGKFVAQHSHEGTPVMAGEPLKSQCFTQNRAIAQSLVLDLGLISPSAASRHIGSRFGSALRY
jgi:hypothetical protein